MWWTREQLGTYEPTGEIFRGSAAVYKHTTRGVHLYRLSDCTWRTSEDDEHDRIDTEDVYKSVGTAPCPESNSHWEYLYSNDSDDGDYAFIIGGVGSFRSGDITVKCSVHT